MMFYQCVPYYIYSCILYYILLCYVMLCYLILSYAMLCYGVSRHPVFLRLERCRQDRFGMTTKSNSNDNGLLDLMCLPSCVHIVWARSRASKKVSTAAVSTMRVAALARFGAHCVRPLPQCKEFGLRARCAREARPDPTPGRPARSRPPSPNHSWASPA